MGPSAPWGLSLSRALLYPPAMTTIEGEEVATRDLLTGIVHIRLRMEDGRYAVFHRNVGTNPFEEVDRSTVKPGEWCPQCVARPPSR